MMISDDTELRRLEREFDTMLAAMQTEDAARTADSLFEMSPQELGEAAVRMVISEAGQAGDD